MGFHVLRAADHSWEERLSSTDAPARHVVDVTTAAGLTESRARIWRLSPGSRGRRHKELVQEEVFVVVSGTLTMLLGDPPERVELAPSSIVSVEAGTGLQLRNESEDDAVVFVYGAPPVSGKAEYLDEVDP